jgi:hypothetical protein
LFILILDVISEIIVEDTPWAMLFVDDLVLCDKLKEEMEQRLETWRRHMENEHRPRRRLQQRGGNKNRMCMEQVERTEEIYF